jgi:hypothetical protein
MTALALGLVLLGAVGLAIDTAQLYAHRQMAQAAADAAAQAAILSIFNQTNVGGNSFATATDYTHTCSTTDAITPCSFARKNGFGGEAADTVYVDVPTAGEVGIDPASLSADDPVNLIRVTVTRSVSTWFIPMIGGAAAASVKAIAVAACVKVVAPTPILVTHPNLPHSLSTVGNTTIRICGGPNVAVQVNSADPLAYASPKAGGTVDLSKAGPADSGNCTTGTGADFGVFGGSVTNPGGVVLGSTGHYVSPSSMAEDPFAHLAVPAVPPAAPAPVNIASPTDGCAYAKCVEYSPGLYTGGLNISGGSPVIFKPGLYYIQSTKGFVLKNVDGGQGLAGSYSAMCSTCTADADTGTGMVVYDTGPAGSTLGNNPTGGFDINTNVQVTLQGSTKTTTVKGHTVPAGPYYGMLFWEDNTANAHIGNKAHSFGQGNGCFTLLGNIYATNSIATMDASPSHYQEIDYNGNPCSNTVQRGYIITSNLKIVGTTTIAMNLDPYGYVSVRKIALVK